ncbi:MAG: polynucleotide kinase-phosphatase [Helicobacteraceae bacterium]|jgi:protein phosphatase|nr:polynucleotide kinase-phosphatase [Helicobacteraceae bacterium]
MSQLNKALEIPELALIALIGVSGSGKSTFAKKHFKPTEILSSDYFRALVSDDENNQAVSSEAFDALYYLANKRLDLGKLTVIDATSVQKEAREKIVHIARAQNCHAIAIVLNTPEKLCIERNEKRSDRNFGDYVIRKQYDQLRRSIKRLEKEGFRYVYIIDSEEEANSVEIARKPLWNNKKDERGAFDIIGDIHGCFNELCALLEKLGYSIDEQDFSVVAPIGRKAIFLGDLCDRGTQNVKTLRLVMNMVKNNSAYCILGNHDYKLLRYMKGAKVVVAHGLELTIAELEKESAEFCDDVKSFLGSLISHYVFDNGNLVVAHAGIKEKMQGRGSETVKTFCLYGETSGEIDEYGLPIRLSWANDYRGKALVVYGHTPNLDVQNVNNTICIDTGCVFGGKLSAFRYPEREIVEIAAAKEYYKSVKPLISKSFIDDDTLNIDDVLNRRYLSTRLNPNIKINEENAIAALEIMSRFAIDPHWLIYLPPTMSPCETSRNEEYLEYPIEAFEYYSKRGVGAVVCEQKHMGSRAIIVLCKNELSAAKRFNVSDGKIGVIYTRTGRDFFSDPQTELAILERLNKVLTDSSFWEDFQTDWICLDTELTPWSAKAQTLISQQYASVGQAGRSALEAANAQIEKAAKLFNSAQIAQRAAKRGESSQSADINALLSDYKSRYEALTLYTQSYRGYCWEIKSIDDYKIAPFHILATEGKVWNNESHIAHMEIIRKHITGFDQIFIETPYKIVDTTDENSIAIGVKWWEKLTQSGGEGMVVKPYDFIATDNNRLLQPAIKCRGREYLRIIYGPEYALKNNLARLKKRSLNKKRDLALREFALGMESLERFAKKDPLYRVHECVFGVLALESEPVDPRL